MDKISNKDVSVEEMEDHSKQRKTVKEVRSTSMASKDMGELPKGLRKMCFNIPTYSNE